MRFLSNIEICQSTGFAKTDCYFLYTINAVQSNAQMHKPQSQSRYVAILFSMYLHTQAEERPLYKVIYYTLLKCKKKQRVTVSKHPDAAKSSI